MTEEQCQLAAGYFLELLDALQNPKREAVEGKSFREIEDEYDMKYDRTIDQLEDSKEEYYLMWINAINSEDEAKYGDLYAEVCEALENFSQKT